MFCSNCGNEVAGNAVVCVKCGVPPRVEKKFCYNCGSAVSENQAVCVKCGIALTASKIPVARNVVEAKQEIVIADGDASLCDLSEPTGGYVAKTIFTFQFYGILTLYRYFSLNQNEAVRTALSPTKLFVTMLLYGLYPFCYAFGGIVTGSSAVSLEEAMLFWDLVSLLPVAGGIMLIVMSFALKNAVIQEAERKGISNYQMNGFYLFLFNIFYINFCLNEIKNK